MIPHSFPFSLCLFLCLSLSLFLFLSASLSLYRSSMLFSYLAFSRSLVLSSSFPLCFPLSSPVSLHSVVIILTLSLSLDLFISLYRSSLLLCCLCSFSSSFFSFPPSFSLSPPLSLFTLSFSLYSALSLPPFPLSVSLSLKRTLFNLPTQKVTSPFKSENEIRRKKKLQAAMHQAAVHQAAVHQDLLKRTDQNVRPQQACRGKIMYLGLYIKIVIFSSILLNTLFYIAKNSTKSIYIYIYIYIYILYIYVPNLKSFHRIANVKFNLKGFKIFFYIFFSL